MIKILIIIVPLLLFCNRNDHCYLQLSTAHNYNTNQYLPKNIKAKFIALLTDTIKAKCLSSLECLTINDISYYVVQFKSDTIRVITKCEEIKRDSIYYYSNIFQDSIKIYPSEPINSKDDFPSYGNVPDWSDTIGFITTFGKTVWYKRKIPTNLDECINELDEILSSNQKEKLRKLSQEKYGLGAVHMGLGMWIRNGWGLWGGSELQRYFIKHGIDHPDKMSGAILSEYCKRINKR